MVDYSRLAEAGFVGLGVGVGLVIGVAVVSWLRRLDRRLRDDQKSE